MPNQFLATKTEFIVYSRIIFLYSESNRLSSTIEGNREMDQ